MLDRFVWEIFVPCTNCSQKYILALIDECSLRWSEIQKLIERAEGWGRISSTAGISSDPIANSSQCKSIKLSTLIATMNVKDVINFTTGFIFCLPLIIFHILHLLSQLHDTIYGARYLKLIQNFPIHPDRDTVSVHNFWWNQRGLLLDTLRNILKTTETINYSSLFETCLSYFA